MTRDKEKASILFSTDTDKLELVVADGRVSEQIKIAFSPTSAGRVRAVIDCTGTTAFPSARWKDNNDPSTTSTVVKNIVDAANGIDASDSDNNDKDFIRYVFLSSIGVDRMSSFPFLILNFFGALEHKKIAEDYIKQSGKNGAPISMRAERGNVMIHLLVREYISDLLCLIYFVCRSSIHNFSSSAPHRWALHKL